MNFDSSLKPQDFKAQGEKKGENTPKTPQHKKHYKKHREKRPPKKITEKYLYNAGLAYLQRFTASTTHFKRVMMRKINRSCKHHIDQDKETCAAILDKTVKKFEDLQLLNDEAYAKGMVNSYRNKGLSAKIIMLKLKQKGLNADEIETALHIIDEEIEGHHPDYIAGLKFIRRKKLGAFITREKEFDKQLAALARNGYGYGMAQKILETPLEEAEEILRHAAL